MSKLIFVNLPVKNLVKTKEFFARLGFKYNPQFTDENAACMVISQEIFVMLLAENSFESFTKKPITDTRKSSEVIVALSAGSRQEVDEFADRALAAGGTSVSEAQDMGFMYSRNFRDPDGHMWEILYMDPSHIDPF